MKILNKIFSTGAKELTESIGSAIDKLSTSEQEKLNAKNTLTEIVTSKLSELAAYQKEVLVTELKGTKLQRSWRPIVMLAFAAIVVYAKFIAPAFGLPNAELEAPFWNLLEISIGGYVIGRSLEKVTDKVTQNVDLSFIKKRHRVDANN
ncbi:MAG: hypothetical protein GY751_26800 [Bacteroidetes bacterium]|nr:hypothetical protein [Bacteroidota bacterium]